jgi:hypothetical protein
LKYKGILETYGKEHEYYDILKLHESETSWIKSDFDLEINNNNSIEELEKRIGDLVYFPS